MPEEQQDVVAILKSELEFIEYGGYGFPNRWDPTMFADSPTCLNYGYPYRTHPCAQCVLMRFVPPDKRSSSMPCHYIPLDASGRTIEAMENAGSPQDLQETVKAWLRQAIRRMESQPPA
jgi:hypothetical protein